MTTITPAQATDLIRNRRAIYPRMYTDQPIPKEILMEILENANWAPTHRHTEPWRFKVFLGEARKRLANYLSDYYITHTPKEKFSEMKLKKMQKPMQCAAVVAICMQRDPMESVPEWEEIAAVACAVQNMWLTCTAYNIGCYWSTPQAMIEGEEFLKLKEGEKCWGVFYMGYHKMGAFSRKRGAIEEKIEWIDTE